MKKVLLIYHSLDEISAIRILGLVNFLPEFGWNPVVLTRKFDSTNSNLHYQNFNIVTTPSRDIPQIWKKRLQFMDHNSPISYQNSEGSKNAKFRTFQNNIIKILWEDFVTYPDSIWGWYPYAVKTGLNLLKDDEFKAIISSFRPATLHLIGAKLREKSGKPWIADFRDLWTQEIEERERRRRNPVRGFLEYNLETKTCKRADCMVTISKALSEKFKEIHPNKRIYCIPNGFDPDEINKGQGTTDEFTITYAGALYASQKYFRDPRLVMRSVADLIKKGKINKNEIKIRFFGLESEGCDLIVEIANKYGLIEIVEIFEKIDRQKLFEIQRESQILLIINRDHPGEIGTVTGKVFEYLAARRPILAVGGPRGELANIINTTNAGVFAESESEVERFLMNSYNDWKKNGEVSYLGKMDEINKYSHREMAKRYAELLDKVCVE